MTTLLRAEKLSKRYGQIRALDDVSFDVEEGVTGLLGANGAGKSTALKLFLGLIQPDSGTAAIVDDEGLPRVEARQRIGYMPEHDCLPDAVPAAEFLAHMAEVSGLPRVAARVRATDVLRHVGLFEERYRPVGTYSTGMKQRVKLAQALVHDPTVVLLDEPTAGLDPIGREEMLELIRRTGKEFGISVILSSHLMGDVEATCDRIIVLEDGHVAQEGAVSGYTRETQTILVDVDDHRDELVAALIARGIDAKIEGYSVALVQDSEERFDDIRDALVEVGARLRRMAPRRHQLTDIFRSPPR